MHPSDAAAIVRWLVVAAGIIAIAVSFASIRCMQHRFVVVFPVLMASGITANYVHASPVVFPGAVLYLVAYGYLYWVAYQMERRAKTKRRRKDDRVETQRRRRDDP